MIKIDIKDYCEDCPDFEPRTTKFFCDNKAQIYIECEYRHKCERLVKHLEEQKNDAR